MHQQQSAPTQPSSPPTGPNSATNFLTLPHEVRDKIYTLALTSPDPIIVWSGNWERIFKRDEEGFIIDSTTAKYQRIVDKSATDTSLQNLATSLFLCRNITIAYEAAQTFYSGNVFSFRRYHNWDPVVSWLECIGPRNRAYLRKLQVSVVERPEHAWQLSDGSRVRVPNFWLMEELYPRSPHLHCAQEGEWKEGEVQNINPAMERIFKLLARKREGGKNVSVEVRLDEHFLPGVLLRGEEGRECPRWHYFSLDLPNLIEKFRAEYATRRGCCGAIKVLWRGKTLLEYLKKNRSLIEERGWEIVEPKEPDWPQPWKARSERPLLGPIQWTEFVLKRKEWEVDDVLVAADPSPYSHW